MQFIGFCAGPDDSSCAGCNSSLPLAPTLTPASIYSSGGVRVGVFFCYTIIYATNSDVGVLAAGSVRGGVPDLYRARLEVGIFLYGT